MEHNKAPGPDGFDDVVVSVGGTPSEGVDVEGSSFLSVKNLKGSQHRKQKISYATRRKKPKQDHDLLDGGSNKEIESHPRRKPIVFCRGRGWLVDPRN